MQGRIVTTKEVPLSTESRDRSGDPGDASSSGQSEVSHGVPQDPARTGDAASAASPGAASPGAASPGAASAQEPAKPPTPFTQQLGRVVLVLLVVAFGVFAASNSQHVDFSWLVGETTVTYDAGGERVAGGVPLIVLLTASLALGILVGALLSWQGARAKRRAAKNRATGTKKRS